MTRTRIIAMGAAVSVLVVAGFGGWYFLIRGDVPPAVNLADAIASISSPTPEPGIDATEEPTAPVTPDSSTVVTPSATADPERPSATAEALSGDGLVGDWVLASDGESFVGYRVDEELARAGSTTAVGRTSDLTAALSFDGSAITVVEIDANMLALRSDDNRRDGALRRQALESNEFPRATFSLTTPIVLDAEPVDGVPIAVTAIGDFTLHGVTRNISIPVEGQIVGDRVVVIGSTSILLSDYEIGPPSAIAVISVADVGTIEFQLIFERA